MEIYRMPIKLAVLFPLISIIAKFLSDCNEILEMKHLTINFIVEQFFIILLLVISMLKPKYRWELEKVWFPRNALNNGYGLLLKYTTFMFTMELSMQNCSSRIARTTIRFCPFLIQTIMYMTWNFVVHILLHQSKYWAHNLDFWSFTVKYDVWLNNCICQIISLVWNIWNYSPRQRPTIVTYSKKSLLGLLCLCPWSKAPMQTKDS